MNVIVNKTDDEKSNVEERESCTTLDALIKDEGSKVASNGSWRVASSFTVLPLQNCSMGPGSRSRTYTLPFGACKKKSPDGRSAPNNFQSPCEAALCSDEAVLQTSRVPPARPAPPQPTAYSSAARPPAVPPYPETKLGPSPREDRIIFEDDIPWRYSEDYYSPCLPPIPLSQKIHRMQSHEIYPPIQTYSCRSRRSCDVPMPYQRPVSCDFPGVSCEGPLGYEQCERPPSLTCESRIFEPVPQQCPRMKPICPRLRYSCNPNNKRRRWVKPFSSSLRYFMCRLPLFRCHKSCEGRQLRLVPDASKQQSTRLCTDTAYQEEEVKPFNIAKQRPGPSGKICSQKQASVNRCNESGAWVDPPPANPRRSFRYRGEWTSKRGSCVDANNMATTNNLRCTHKSQNDHYRQDWNQRSENYFEQSQHALCATFDDAPQTWNDYTRSASYEPKTYPNKLYPQSEDQCDDCVQSSFVVSNGDIWEMVSVHGEVDDEETLSPMSSKPLSGKASPPCTDSPRRVASSRHAFKQLFSYQQKTTDICDRGSRTQINYPSSTQNMVKVCKRVCSSLKQDNISRQLQCTNFEGPSKQNYEPPPNSTPQLNLEHEYTNELQHKCIEPPRRPLQMDFDIEYHKQPPQKCEQPPRRTNMDNFQPSRGHCKLPQKIYEPPLERAQRSNDLSSNKQSLQNYQPSACSQARKGCKSCSILTRIHPPSKRDSQEYLPPSTTFRSRFDDPTYDVNTIEDYKSKTERSRKSTPSKCPPVSGCGPLPIDHQSWMHYPQNESCIDPNGHTLNQEHPMICWPKPQCSQMFTNRPAFCKYSNSARITPTKYSPSSLLFQNLPSTPQCNKVSNCSNSDRFKPSTPYQVLNSPAAEIPKSIKNCALRDNNIPKCAVPDPNLTACDQPDNSCPPEVCRTCTQLPRSLPERRTGSVPPLPSTVYDTRKNFTDLPNQNCSKPNMNQNINSFATEGHSSASASSSESISLSSTSASCDQSKPCANPSPKQHKKETFQKSELALLEDGHKSPVTNPPDGPAPSEQKPLMKRHQLGRNATSASVECTENVLDSVEDNGKPVKPVRENRWQESRKKPVPQEDQCETHEKRKPWWKKFAKNSGKWKCSESVKAKYTK